MTVREMIEAKLREGGFDGLYSEDGECACLVGDLFPCDQPWPDCQAGNRIPCTCGDHDFHVGPRRRE